MEPMRHHMHGGLLRSADTWNVLQHLRATSSEGATIVTCREWPLLTAASGVRERKALEEIKDLHSTAQRMDCLLPVQRTLRLSNMLYKMLSRQGARFHQLLVNHCLLPFILFMLLVDPAVTIAAIRTTCASARDTYSQSYIDYYGMENPLDPKGLAELTLIVILIVCSTVRLENGNAGIKHCLSTMSNHVTVPKLARISGDRLLARARSRQRHRKAPPGLTTHTRKARRSQKQRRITRDRVRRGLAPQRQTPKKPHGGGACRALISRRCRGVEKPDFRQLARDYSQLGAAEKAELQGPGMEATNRVRAGEPGFLKRPRDVVREQERAAKRRRGDALDSGALVPVHPAADSLETLPGVIKTMKKDKKAIDCARREKDHETAAALLSWRQSNGVVGRDRFIVGAPGTEANAHCVSCDCSKPRESLHTWSFPADVCVPRTIATLRAQTCELCEACNKDFYLMHRLVKHDEQPPIIDPPKRKAYEKISCLEADGVCLCGDDGDALWKFKLWFCKATSNALGAPPLKHMLDGGDIVVRLLSSYDEDESDCPEERTEVDRWFGVAVHFFSPWKSWVRELLWPSRTTDERGHRHLRTTDTYFTMYQFLADVYQPSSDWDIRFYAFVDEDMPLEHIDPTRIRVRHLDVSGPTSATAITSA